MLDLVVALLQPPLQHPGCASHSNYLRSRFTEIRHLTSCFLPVPLLSLTISPSSLEASTRRTRSEAPELCRRDWPSGKTLRFRWAEKGHRWAPRCRTGPKGCWILESNEDLSEASINDSAGDGRVDHRQNGWADCDRPDTASARSLSPKGGRSEVMPVSAAPFLSQICLQCKRSRN